MPEPSPALLQSLDTPLPTEISGSGHGWFTRYRVFPVFSPRWVRGRLQVWLVLALVMLVLALVPLLGLPAGEMPLGGVVQLVVQLLLPIVAGPWLCSLVRQRGGPPGQEWWTLVAMMALLTLAMLAFHAWGAEPLKQWIAERTGAVDESGKRKRMVMAIGVSVSTPDETAGTSASGPASTSASTSGSTPASTPVSTPSSAASASDARKRFGSDAPNQLINGASSALVTFWLAGGAGLWGWRRERSGLAALAHDRELARALAQRREAELRLSVLAAQVEPHFLFNTLAGVRSAIRTDPARASDMIDHLVDYLRAAIPRLRVDGSADATLGGQLDIVRAYLALMAARMPRLSFSIDAPADLLGAACPPLMLISLAENAVKHGVEPKVGPAHIGVTAKRSTDGRLAVTVADNGAGFDAQGSAGGGGLGLSNIRERLRQMHGERAALTLRARADGGVAATLTVPMD